MREKIKIAFFGTPDFSVKILEKLKEGNFLPSLIITAPDRPKGRGLILTPAPVKVWAEKNNIKIFQPETLKDMEILETLEIGNFDLFIVASYGLIIPKKILDIPRFETLNVHTSLLPKLRGASPIETTILLGEKETGTTIMLMDEKMDHGPIIAQEKFELSFNINADELENKLAEDGGNLLVKVIQDWVSGKIEVKEQNHEEATFCKKIKKAHGEIFQGDSEKEKYRKYLAYFNWPKTFFFDEDGKRIKITKARLEGGKFIIKKVIPEGKREVDYK